MQVAGELLQGDSACTEEDVGVTHSKWEEQHVQRAGGRNSCGVFLKQKGGQ